MGSEARDRPVRRISANRAATQCRRYNNCSPVNRFSIKRVKLRLPMHFPMSCHHKARSDVAEASPLAFTLLPPISLSH